MKEKKCSKQCSTQTNFKRGFTLLELLVVVLIIGILAGIALPQYQIAVAKSQFATLKNITKSIQQAAQRYYMVNGTYDLAAKDLDIDLNITGGANSRVFKISKNIECTVWKEGEQALIACDKQIFKTRLRYYVSRENGRPNLCAVWSVDTNDKPNRLCQKETGKTAAQADCVETYCRYYY